MKSRLEVASSAQSKLVPEQLCQGLAALSVNEFCTAHSISRALFYLLQRDGSGPRLMRVRGRTLVTAEAAADWRRRMELSTETA
jgi:hypothetical protein